MTATATTSTTGAPGPAARAAAARERLAPVIAAAAEGVVAREAAHELPVAQVRALAAAGLGRLRVPTEHGGDGLDLPATADLLVDLAAADSNLPQVFRGHLAWVEHLLSLPASEHRDAWFARVVAGEVVGNAWSEVGDGALGLPQTAIIDVGGRAVVRGRKYYTTGSIFADWTDVTARRGAGVVTALVPTGQPGVTISDDWDGFGQQLTGTGTIVFDDAVVAPEDVAPFDDRFRYQTALYQLVLLVVHAGIAAAVERDTAAAVRGRTRTYSHGLAPLVKDDPQVQAVAGEISSIAFAARQLVRGAAEAVQGAADTGAGGVGRDGAADRAANALAEIRTAQAQVVLSESVPRAATLLFDTLGASATSRARGLDRHWRNARTVASHNPVIYKARIVGDWSVNGTVPPYVWEIGTHPSAASASSSPTG